MDPNLFHLDYERMFEVLVAIVVLSMIVERALSILFESRLFIDKTEGVRGVKEIITFILCVVVCVVWKFDAISVIVVSTDKMTIPGMVTTAAVIAGGSKGSDCVDDWGDDDIQIELRANDTYAVYYTNLNDPCMLNN